MSHFPKTKASLVAYSALLLLQGCGGGSDAPTASPEAKALSCDDSMKSAFKPDADTTILLVKAFKKGDPLALSGTPPSPAPASAPNDLCLVKLNVGPGNSGPASEPSTTAGIGIEVWLPTPANWNGRIHNIGGGGWQGGSHGSVTSLELDGVNSSLTSPGVSPAVVAGTENSVSASTDTGHSIPQSGSFAMNPDGTINTVSWADFSRRSQRELAIKTKALTAAYYGKPQKFAYFDGCSTGGRQGYSEVQNNPEDYDGYLLGAPAINWTQFLGADQYPAVVTQNDLGGVPLTLAQQNLVSGSAISSCDVIGGQHLGYLNDPLACKYDPLKDASVLCAGSTINGVTGTNTTAACVTPTQATAMIKFWFGPTANGSAPDPAVDNGSQATLSGQQLFYGMTRGTNTAAVSGANGFFLSSDMLGLSLQDPSYASASFRNATGNGQDKWRSLDYAGLANAVNRGIALQSSFGNIDTNNPDLSKARASGIKIIHYHGLADRLITPLNSLNYYNKVQEKMGGYAATQTFNRLFFVPGMDHCAGPSGVSGTAGPIIDGNNIPLPVKSPLFYDALVNWVEKSNAPSAFTATSKDNSRSQLICMFPAKATYNGTGDIKSASSYSCK